AERIVAADEGAQRLARQPGSSLAPRSLTRALAGLPILLDREAIPDCDPNGRWWRRAARHEGMVAPAPLRRATGAGCNSEHVTPSPGRSEESRLGGSGLRFRGAPHSA